VTRRHPLDRLLQQEIESPASDRALFDRLAEEFPDQRALLDFLALRLEHSQRHFFLRAERAWVRRFGWRIIRPFLVVSLLASVGFALQRAIDPTLGVVLFLAGAAALYVVMQLLLMRWAARSQRRLPDLEAEYRDRLQEQLERLRAGSGGSG
jgi:hypothetical protein